LWPLTVKPAADSVRAVMPNKYWAGPPGFGLNGRSVAADIRRWARPFPGLTFAVLTAPGLPRAAAAQRSSLPCPRPGIGARQLVTCAVIRPGPPRTGGEQIKQSSAAQAQQLPGTREADPEEDEHERGGVRLGCLAAARASFCLLNDKADKAPHSLIESAVHPFWAP